MKEKTMKDCRMKIVADENIPLVETLFSRVGDVRCCAGRSIGPGDLRDADALLVRSVTRVDRSLLEGSRVRFVGTATIGTDHIDKEYLAGQGIAFSDAAGSNANSVAEYVICSLLALAEKRGFELEGKVLGIIGVGHIGSNLEQKAWALGLEVLPNDPPLERERGDGRFVSLDRVLAESDIVTCHVPLTRSGEDATWHLLDEGKLQKLQPHAVLLNTSRGAVVDNGVLKEHLYKREQMTAVLDVWENEPDPDIELVKRVGLGTPHIAGYSLDGKINGTVMLFEALCSHLGLKADVNRGSLYPEPLVSGLSLQTAGRGDQELLHEAFSGIYSVQSDDVRFRGILQAAPEERGRYFDSLRREYPVRREASNTQITLGPYREQLASKLQRLGFGVNRPGGSFS